MSTPIVHFDVAGPDAEALHQFYGRVFGWPVQTMGPGYALIETPEGSPNGAIAEREEAELGLGLGVDDLAAAVARAEAEGGTTIMPPTDNGWVHKAQVADPAGNVITLIENSAKED